MHYMPYFSLFSESQLLDEPQKQWIQKHEDSIFELLRRDAASNADVTESVVSHVLYRETHWNNWKNQGCPSFIREPEKPVLNPRLDLLIFPAFN